MIPTAMYGPLGFYLFAGLLFTCGDQYRERWWQVPVMIFFWPGVYIWRTFL